MPSSRVTIPPPPFPRDVLLARQQQTPSQTVARQHHGGTAALLSDLKPPSLWNGGRVVVARLADQSTLVYTQEPRSERGSLERVHVRSGAVTPIAYFEYGMKLVDPHVVVQDDFVAFTTDDRVLHAFDLVSNKRVMQEVVRADKALRLVMVNGEICVTYVIETMDGPRTLVSRVDLDAQRIAQPDLEIDGQARSVTSHRVMRADFATAQDAMIIMGEAASHFGPFGTRFAAIWDRRDEPLVIPADRIGIVKETIVLHSEHGSHHLVLKENGKLDVSFTALHFVEHPQGTAARWLPPTRTRMLLSVSSPSQSQPSITTAVTSQLLPQRAVRRSLDRVGHSISDSLRALEDRDKFPCVAKEPFLATPLMNDVFTLGMEAQALKWRLGSLGLTLRDPNGASWVVPGSDPSLIVFGELAGGDAGPSVNSEAAHRLLAFYMYPARTNSQPPIVMIDPGSLRVTWVAEDFDSFFQSFLLESERKLPTTIDIVLSLLERDASSSLDDSANTSEPPEWFECVHGGGSKPRHAPPPPDDLLAQERALLATTTDARDLRAVYEALNWPHHIAMVRRWATASPR